MLAQPLIVETLEDYFVPIAVYNNAGGEDQKLLQRFKEPAWNYQVMRFMNADLEDVLPRKDRVWTLNGTARRLAKALEKSGKEVPAYLQNVLIPETDPGTKHVAFAMYCFWTGEAKLGSLDGVIATEAGFYDGHEVVVVSYDPESIELTTLVTAAEKFDCASAVYLPDAEDRELIKNKTRLKNVKSFDPERGYRRAPQSDQKKQLSRVSGLEKLGLTPMQLTKLNSLRTSGASMRQWLSPRQLKAYSGR